MATYQQAEQRAEVGFWVHVGSYVGVVTGLAILNTQRNPDNLWVLWVAGGWGIGVLAHAFAYYGNHDRLVRRVEDRMDRREARHAEGETRSELREQASSRSGSLSDGSE